MRIGLIGENPNDTNSIRELLKLKYDNFIFSSVLKHRKGCQLDNDKFTRLLELEFKSGKYDFLIFIRDLDGFESEKDKLEKRNEWYEKNNKTCNCKHHFLLNIHELEAIFFSDIESLNKIFNLKLKFKNPLMIKNPKEELFKLTSNKYKESKAPEYISKLNYQTILSNYKPLKDLDKAI